MSSDARVRALWADKGLTASVVVVTGAAREGQKLHGLHDVSAMLLGQALSAGALLASLQKDQTRVNLQLECDGPLRGLFVDAGEDGALRGYVKNPYLAVEGNPGPTRWLPALGNSGFLSVLKDLGQAEYYRSSVQLEALDLSVDLGHYFVASEQVATRCALVVSRDGAEPLGALAGVVVQALPDGDLAALETVGAGLGERLAQHALGASAAELREKVLPSFVELSSTPLAWRCSCSKERVLNALSALGVDDLKDLLATKGGAAASCQFCGRRHEASADELRELIRKMSSPS